MLTAPPHLPLAERRLSSLGFRMGRNGAHAARTLMLRELTVLLEGEANSQSSKEDFELQVLDANALSKATASSRQRTLLHLVSLYGLDPGQLVFRLLRHFWALDPSGRPQTALVAARTRDPLLQLGTDFLLPMAPGAVYNHRAFEDFIAQAHPDRFSAKMRASLARNLSSSYTQAGFLVGKARKRRQQPPVAVGAITLALALAWLSGQRGIAALWSSSYVAILGLTPSVGDAAAREASRRGWLDYRRSGEVSAISFRQLADELAIPELT